MSDDTVRDAEVRGDQPEPIFRVVRGNPTAEELAALVVVLSGLRATTGPAPATSSGWGAYWRGLNTPPWPGPNGWRASARNW